MPSHQHHLSCHIIAIMLLSCHSHVLIIPSLCPHCRIIAVLLLPQSPCRIVVVTNVDCHIIAVPSLLSPSHHRVAIAICPHRHSGCTLAATVAVLLHHHRSPSPSHGPALNGCKEIRKTIKTTDNATLQSRCCHKLHIMASGDQQGVSDLKAAVGCKPGHLLHKNVSE